jgi:hypothetical protein
MQDIIYFSVCKSYHGQCQSSIKYQGVLVMPKGDQL